MIGNNISKWNLLRTGLMIAAVLLLACGIGDAAQVLDKSGGEYVSAVSEDYAYIGQSHDFSIVGMLNQAAPISRLTLSSNISNIRVDDNYAYITDDKNRPVTIDISNPVAPVEVKRADGMQYGIQQSGWPINTGSTYMASPVLADFDPDYEGLETIVAASGSIYVWHYDGTPMANWNPLVLGRIVSAHSPPAVGDIDRDGYLDMVVATYANSTEPPKVWIFNRDGTVLPGWPKNVGDAITSAPVLVDLDKDGFLEILVSSKDKNLYIWRHDGSNFSAAWPMWTNRILYYSPVVGDLNNDKNLEIVLATGEGGLVNDYLYIWNLNGSTLNSNWPKTLDYGYFGLTPSLGDIDSDDEMEIVLGTGHDVDTGRVYAWNADGSSVSGNWPRSVSGYAFFSLISDIDPGYPGLEILTSIGSDNKIYAWHSDGSNVTGWPYVLLGEGGKSPAIGDVDGDRSLEIVAGSYNSRVYVIDSNGRNQTGWPKITTGILQTSPAIGDIDNDGQTEIIQPAGNQVYLWKEAGMTNLTWPMLQLDERHNGLYADRSAPASITNLINISYALYNINWTWNDSVNADFDHVEIYLNGGFAANVSKGMKFYNAIGLNPDSEYTISTHTVDIYGNLNQTWRNHTARTMPVITPSIVISGINFNDSNGNGIQDLREGGLANWTIKLIRFDMFSKTIIETTETTKLNGSYSFTNLAPGFYIVFEMQKSGWVSTFPSIRSINLLSDQNIVVNFGNKKIR